VGRPSTISGVGQPLVELEDGVALQQRGRLAVAKVVHLGPVAATDEEGVPEAAGGGERDPRAPPLQQRVETGGGAVHEQVDLSCWTTAELEQLEHAAHQVRRGRQHLGGSRRSRVLHDQVGERPADVDGYPMTHTHLLGTQ
jgi:hypothetical protein